MGLYNLLLIKISCSEFVPLSIRPCFGGGHYKSGRCFGYGCRFEIPPWNETARRSVDHEFGPAVLGPGGLAVPQGNRP
jgi:hypothetical protein